MVVARHGDQRGIRQRARTRGGAPACWHRRRGPGAGRPRAATAAALLRAARRGGLRPLNTSCRPAVEHTTRKILAGLISSFSSVFESLTARRVANTSPEIPHLRTCNPIRPAMSSGIESDIAKLGLGGPGASSGAPGYPPLGGTAAGAAGVPGLPGAAAAAHYPPPYAAQQQQQQQAGQYPPVALHGGAPQPQAAAPALGHYPPVHQQQQAAAPGGAASGTRYPPLRAGAASAGYPSIGAAAAAVAPVAASGSSAGAAAVPTGLYYPAAAPPTPAAAARTAAAPAAPAAPAPQAGGWRLKAPLPQRPVHQIIGGRGRRNGCVWHGQAHAHVASRTSGITLCCRPSISCARCSHPLQDACAPRAHCLHHAVPRAPRPPPRVAAPSCRSFRALQRLRPRQRGL
jgi:hypothetical protein